jgi:hypothetical protein
VRSLELTTQAFQTFPALTSRQSHLTTGTFNLLSKTESAFRLSGALQSNSSSIRTTCPRNLCIPYGRFRRVETNLSNLPQPFTMCQPEIERNRIYFADSGHFVILRFGDRVISNREITNHPMTKSGRILGCLKKIYSSEALATCKTLQSRVLRLSGIALNSSQPWRWDLPFIGFLSDVPGSPADSISVRLNPADCQPLSSSPFIPQQQRIGARGWSAVFWCIRKQSAVSTQHSAIYHPPPNRRAESCVRAGAAIRAGMVTG